MQLIRRLEMADWLWKGSRMVGDASNPTLLTGSSLIDGQLTFDRRVIKKAKQHSEHFPTQYTHCLHRYVNIFVSRLCFSALIHCIDSNSIVLSFLKSFAPTPRAESAILLNQLKMVDVINDFDASQPRLR
jgi:hypothetical protein